MSRSPTDQASDTGLTESEFHRVLADGRRRVALSLLSNRSMPMDLGELAEAMVARGDTDRGPRDEDVDRVAITLHHQHLPVLTEAGVIRYDPASRRIEAIDPTSDLL